MPHTRILGTGHAVPARVVSNHDLAAVMDTSDEWIVQRTGIRQRHWIAEGDTGTGLAKVAAERAIESSGIAPGDIDAIVYATSSPDHMAPGNGVLLQHAMGLGQVPALDIRTQCSGFVYGLHVADAYIRSGLFRTVLVVGAEVQSTGLDVSDKGRNTAVIFADGAGAAVVQAHDDPAGSAVLGWDLHGDGAYADKLWVEAPGAIFHPRNKPDVLAERGFLEMDGREVFRHATTRMPESLMAALANAAVVPDQLKLLIPHQANLRISEMVQKQLGLRDDQVYNNIDRFGNTTAATIPIALDECVRAGRIERGDLIAITAFGSGFLWGSAVIRW
ncbi:MAG TPA: beta-ketoacyl-ACP synthase III [Gemmatimonadales bacterium]|nr:beta-ketoacyl-ACP synthase III [Gemmatimonadales bacterium]